MPRHAFIVFAVFLLAAAIALAGGLIPAAHSVAVRLAPAGTAGEPSITPLQFAAALAWHLPWLLAAPALLTAVGTYFGWRVGRPFRQLLRQLRVAAVTSRHGELHLEAISGRSVESRGWNRLVDLLAAIQMQSGLHERLAAALEGFRQRKGEQILNSLAEGLAVTDDAGRITFANPTMQALLGGGNGSHEPAGNLYERLALNDAQGEASQLLDPSTRERAVVADVPHHDEVGESVLRVGRYPLLDDGGQCTGNHVWMMRDVTQQLLAERMRNEFVNSATHELRTPMANIRAFAETMADNLVEDEQLDIDSQKEFCNIINGEVNRLSRLIDDLLSVESMAVGSLSLDRKETNFERLLLDTMAKVKPMMDQKDVAFETKLPGKLPTLHIDKDKIALTLVNMLGNAAKYTPEGGQVTLRVELRETDVLIHVQDTGIGIEKEELPHIFQRFYRSGDPRVRSQSGTGLGLALAYEIVRLHGGRLTVESELNKGSTFTASLPLSNEL